MINLSIITFLFLIPCISFMIIIFASNSNLIDENQLTLNVKYTGIWTFFLAVLLCLFIIFSFDFTSYLFQFVESGLFLFGTPYKVGIDGISLIFIIINSFLLLAMSFLVKAESFSECKKVYSILLVLYISSLLLFASINLLFFILFFDIISILLYLVLGSDFKEINTNDMWKIAASFSFSSSIVFIAFSYIYIQTGTVNIDELILYDFSSNEQIVLCFATLLSLAMKVGIVPFGRSWVYFCTSRLSSFVYLIVINCLIYSIFRISSSLFIGVIYSVINYVAFILLSLAILNNLIISPNNIYKVSFSHIPIIILSMFLGKDGIIGAIFYLIGYNVIYTCLAVFLTFDDNGEFVLDNLQFWQHSVFIVLISTAAGFLLSSYLVGYLIILQSLFELSGVMFFLGMILWVLLFMNIVLIYPKLVNKKGDYFELLILNIIILFIIYIGVFPNLITDFLGYSFFVD